MSYILYIILGRHNLAASSKESLGVRRDVTNEYILHMSAVRQKQKITNF